MIVKKLDKKFKNFPKVFVTEESYILQGCLVINIKYFIFCYVKVEAPHWYGSIFYSPYADRFM